MGIAGSMCCVAQPEVSEAKETQQATTVPAQDTHATISSSSTAPALSNRDRSNVSNVQEGRLDGNQQNTTTTSNAPSNNHHNNHTSNRHSTFTSIPLHSTSTMVLATSQPPSTSEGQHTHTSSTTTPPRAVAEDPSAGLPPPTVVASRHNNHHENSAATDGTISTTDTPIESLIHLEETSTAHSQHHQREQPRQHQQQQQTRTRTSSISRRAWNPLVPKGSTEDGTTHNSSSRDGGAHVGGDEESSLRSTTNGVGGVVFLPSTAMSTGGSSIRELGNTLPFKLSTTTATTALNTSNMNHHTTTTTSAPDHTSGDTKQVVAQTLTTTTINSSTSSGPHLLLNPGVLTLSPAETSQREDDVVLPFVEEIVALEPPSSSVGPRCATIAQTAVQSAPIDDDEPYHNNDEDDDDVSDAPSLQFISTLALGPAPPHLVQQAAAASQLATFDLVTNNTISLDGVVQQQHQSTPQLSQSVRVLEQPQQQPQYGSPMGRPTPLMSVTSATGATVDPRVILSATPVMTESVLARQQLGIAAHPSPPVSPQRRALFSPTAGPNQLGDVVGFSTTPTTTSLTTATTSGQRSLSGGELAAPPPHQPHPPTLASPMVLGTARPPRAPLSGLRQTSDESPSSLGVPISGLPQYDSIDIDDDRKSSLVASLRPGGELMDEDGMMTSASASRRRSKDTSGMAGSGVGVGQRSLESSSRSGGGASGGYPAKLSTNDFFSSHGGYPEDGGDVGSLHAQHHGGGDRGSCQAGSVASPSWFPAVQTSSNSTHIDSDMGSASRLAPGEHNHHHHHPRSIHATSITSLGTPAGAGGHAHYPRSPLYGSASSTTGIAEYHDQLAQRGSGSQLLHVPSTRSSQHRVSPRGGGGGIKSSGGPAAFSSIGSSDRMFHHHGGVSNNGNVVVGAGGSGVGSTAGTPRYFSSTNNNNNNNNATSATSSLPQHQSMSFPSGSGHMSGSAQQGVILQLLHGSSTDLSNHGSHTATTTGTGASSVTGGTSATTPTSTLSSMITTVIVGGQQYAGNPNPSDHLARSASASVSAPLAFPFGSISRHVGSQSSLLAGGGGGGAGLSPRPFSHATDTMSLAPSVSDPNLYQSQASWMQSTVATSIDAQTPRVPYHEGSLLRMRWTSTVLADAVGVGGETPATTPTAGGTAVTV